MNNVTDEACAGCGFVRQHAPTCQFYTNSKPLAQEPVGVTDDDRATAAELVDKVYDRFITAYRGEEERRVLIKSIALLSASTRTTAYAKGKREAVEGIRVAIAALRVPGIGVAHPVVDDHNRVLDHALAAIDAYEAGDGLVGCQDWPTA